MTLSNNPFAYDVPIVHGYNPVFVPDPCVPKIADDLISRHCCLIIGPPASGTTSTLQAVRDAYQARFPDALWWSLDLLQLPACDETSLFSALAVESRAIFADQETHWSRVANYNSFSRALLKSVMALRLPLVLAIDHIEYAPFSVAQIVVRGVRSLYSRRDERNAPEKLIAVVIAGSRRLRRQGVEYGSPLNFAHAYYIQDLEPRTAVQMLASAGEGRGWAFDPKAAQYLVDETGGSKYLLQRLAHTCVETVIKNKEGTITLDLVQRVVDDFCQAGFRSDPKLNKLLPSLMQDRYTLEVLLELLENPTVGIPQFQVLRADISPDVTMVLKQEGSLIGIRNSIYRRILAEHRPILESAYGVLDRVERKLMCARQFQELTAQADLFLTDGEGLEKALDAIRKHMGCDHVLLHFYDEVERRLVLVCSTQGITAAVRIAPSLQEKIIKVLQEESRLVRCESIAALCLADRCIHNEPSDCAWIPLKVLGTGQLVGSLTLVAHSVVVSRVREKELIDLGATLAEALQRWRYLQGLRKLAHLIVDLPPDQVRREICAVMRTLFNKPYAFLWQGDVNWPPIHLQMAIGLEPKQLELFDLYPTRDLCMKPDSSEPQTKLILEDRQAGDPRLARLLQQAGLKRLLLVGFRIGESGQFGILGTGTPDLWQPTDTERMLAQLVGKQTMVILANLGAYQVIQQRLDASKLSERLLSHELNRAPAAIAEELELLLCGREGVITSGQRERLDRVQRYVNNHQQLIQRLLDVSRLDAGTFRAQMSVQPIRPILSKVLNDLEKEVETVGMQLVIELAPRLPAHRLDAVLVEQIMTNLVRNSKQYAKEGPILVRARGEAGNTIITVEDHGPGVPPEFQNLIFQPWHRGKHSQNIAGSGHNLGLGLYFVCKLMELHGGRVEYDASYLDGARFRLVFPGSEGG